MLKGLVLSSVYHLYFLVCLFSFLGYFVSRSGSIFDRCWLMVEFALILLAALFDLHYASMVSDRAKDVED